LPLAAQPAGGAASGFSFHFIISVPTDHAGKIGNFRVFHLFGPLILPISTRYAQVKQLAD
jgi:hypothetical protein